MNELYKSTALETCILFGKTRQMKPGKNDVVFHTPLANCWLEDQVLCKVSNNEPRTTANIQEHYDILKERLTQPVSWLLDFSTCQSFEPGVKRVIEKEVPAMTKAIAIIAASPCSKMLASVFLKLAEKGIPVKLFDDESSARKWLNGNS